MTNGEIALAIIAACFAAYGLLMSFGNYFDRRRFSKKLQIAGHGVRASEANAQYYQRKLVKTQESWEALVQRVERVKSRILNAESHECRLRFERKGEPSCYYGAQHGHIARGLAEALNILEQETWPRHDTRQQAAEARVGAPAHGPVTGCVVCGGPTFTHRWGQCDYEEATQPGYAKVTVRLGKYDYWQTRRPLPLCKSCLRTVDRYSGTVVFYIQTEPKVKRESRLPGSPIPGTYCAVCHTHEAVYLIYGRRLTVDGCHLFERIRPDCMGFEWLPACSDAKRAFDERGYVSIQPRFGGYHCG